MPALAPSPGTIERPAQLAQGSVTAPLPSATPRKRPATVEFPTIESSVGEEILDQTLDQTIDRTVVDHRASAPDPRPLPSIFSVIDRRHAPEMPRTMAEFAAAAFAPPAAPVSIRPRASSWDAVPEPIVPEVAPVTEPQAFAPMFAPEPPTAPAPPPFAPQSPLFEPELALAPRSAPVRRTAPVAASAPTRPRRPTTAAPVRQRQPTFSEAEAAFFAAGEELERVEHDPFLDELDPPAVKRPTLWRRLTGRGR